MEPVNQTDTTRSYLDFEGLGQLRGQARKDGKAALRETAQQFEGMFLQMMLKSMRDATVKSDLVESSGAETFEAMFDKEVSVQLSKRNMMGVADMLVQTQSRQMSPPPSTDELLKSRGTASKGFPLNQPGKAYALDAAVPMLNPLKLPGGPFPLPKMDNLSTRSKP